jgi:hypothetical protein
LPGGVPPGTPRRSWLGPRGLLRGRARGLLLAWVRGLLGEAGRPQFKSFSFLTGTRGASGKGRPWDRAAAGSAGRWPLAVMRGSPRLCVGRRPGGLAPSVSLFPSSGHPLRAASKILRTAGGVPTGCGCSIPSLAASGGAQCILRRKLPDPVPLLCSGVCIALRALRRFTPGIPDPGLRTARGVRFIVLNFRNRSLIGYEIPAICTRCALRRF